MENSNYFDELITAYLSRDLSAEEEVFVLDWINSSAENRQYFEEIRKTWILVAAKHTAQDINIDSEWNQFKQLIGARQLILSSPEDKTLKCGIKEKKNAGERSRLALRLASVSAAALMVLFLFFGWKSVFQNSPVKSLLLREATKTHGAESSIIQYVNTTLKPENLILKDGTRVRLHSKSKISYPSPFLGNRRDVMIEGKAEFIVAKDKVRPFTVFSGDITTTALGTHFTVTAFRNDKSISVALYEGKVVVRSGNYMKQKLGKDFYLLPGQELVYNNEYVTARVSQLFSGQPVIAKGNDKNETHTSDNPSVPKAVNGNWYMFNNQLLSQVFDQLEVLYDVDIVYTKQDLSKIYFIGTFDVSDSLEVVLKQITWMNNLKVTKKNNTFIISK